MPVSRAEVCQDWKTRGYDCNTFVAGSGWASSDHTHSSDELVIAVEGQVALIVGEQRFAAEPGGEIFLPSNTVHHLKNLYDGRLEMLFGLKSTVGTVQ